jgi:hypothetical protein
MNEIEKDDANVLVLAVTSCPWLLDTAVLKK